MYSSSERERITIQFGPFSNFIGAHYWNLQHKLLEDEETNVFDEKYVNKRLYKCVNESASTESWLPRALIFDTR